MSIIFTLDHQIIYNSVGILIWALDEEFKAKIDVTVKEEMQDGDSLVI